MDDEDEIKIILQSKAFRRGKRDSSHSTVHLPPNI